ncbi:MAG: hypothetical protein C0609_12070 [Deltaproteobacteria bacterium]|nr:MAG: hypothetical protein C0609_12070 [Deltaproteobacteria bacterium]
MGQLDFAAILTGGRATRMGANKSLLPTGGVPLVERVYEAVYPLAGETLCVGTDVGLPVVTVPDLFPGADSLGGIATALDYARQKNGEDALVLCVGCDMPLIRRKLLEGLIQRAEGYEVVVPRNPEGYEPLLAIYRASCFSTIASQIESGNLRVRAIFGKLKTREVSGEELAAMDPDGRSFFNVNRPEDLAALSELEERGL